MLRVMKILVLNAGSSSQKCCLYDLNDRPIEPIEPLWEAQIDWTHQPNLAEVTVKTAQGESRRETPNADRAG